jgi:hypothetical protein
MRRVLIGLTIATGIFAVAWVISGAVSLSEFISKIKNLLMPVG